MKDTIYQNSHGETDNQNKSVCIKEVESIMNSLPKHKAQGPVGFTGEIYQTLKEKTDTNSLLSVPEDRIRY